MIAKTHGKATTKRENQQQLDLMKWVEEGVQWEWWRERR
jgi:hypothetical protein